MASKGWPADCHVIGVDIAKFHAVYWPGMLAALGLDPPKQLLVHGLFTKDGVKMGKSLGRGGGGAVDDGAGGGGGGNGHTIEKLAFNI